MESGLMALRLSCTMEPMGPIGGMGGSWFNLSKNQGLGRLSLSGSPVPMFNLAY